MSALREIYNRQLAQRGFKSDPAQLTVVAELEALRSKLLAADRRRSGARGWFNRLTRGAEEPTAGLYLWGSVGRGKTWLMDMFFQSLPLQAKRRRHFHRFMHDVHASLKSLGEMEDPLDQVAAGIAQQARVLCFDELYVNDIADAMILGNLFGGLFSRGVTLVVTSNVAPRDLYRDGLQRQRFIPAIELLEQHTRVVNMDGAMDYRLRQLKQAGTYLPSQAPDTAQRLQALFEELSDGTGEASGSIEIEGRRIPIVRASDNVAWFEFSALCEGPRSAADYIEIARDYQSVLLTDVPILDETHENSARRFIALVDELYDHNVNLIIAAAAAPPELYRSERLGQPFQRTVSRLIEMQSEEYLRKEHRG